jgi:hypothetical protein
VKKIIEHPTDPVFVSPSTGGIKVQLRIGEPRRGESRIAELTTGQARMVAYALLYEAARKDEIYDQSRMQAK